MNVEATGRENKNTTREIVAKHGDVDSRSATNDGLAVSKTSQSELEMFSYLKQRMKIYEYYLSGMCDRRLCRAKFSIFHNLCM